MLAAIKEIGIFIILAQAVLHFVPGTAYVKYVKALVGIMLIAKMAEPVLSLAWGEEGELLRKQGAAFENMLSGETANFETGDGSVGIYDSIEEELKSRLNAGSDTGYYVEKAELKGISGAEYARSRTEEYVELTVVKNKGEGNSKIKQEGSPVEIEKITLSPSGKDVREEEKVSEEAKSTEKNLKEAYGKCLGMDVEKIKIIFG